MNQILLLFLMFLPTTYARVDKVFVQCAVSQGNGFNWGSTLGWLSETTRQSAQKARDYENKHPKHKAYVDAQCFNGASSASFVAAVYDQLLSNRHILDTPKVVAGRRLLTATQAFRLADALHFLALSTDFTEQESKVFIRQAIRYALGFYPQTNRQNMLGLDFWKPGSDAKTVVHSVSQWITAAAVLPFERHRDLLASPLFSKREQLAHLNERDFERMKEQQIDRMKQARDLIEQYKRPKLYQRFYRQSLSDHLCVSVFLQPASKTMTVPFAYNELQLAFLCNEKTFHTLTRGKALKKLLSQSSITKDRIIVATTEDWGTALNVSMREPELLALISGKLRHSHLGIKKAVVFNRGRYQTLDTNRDYLVIGGFPEQRMKAWIPYALMLEQKNVYEQQNIEVEARLSVFGKIDIRDRVASFAEKTIAKYFGGEDKLPHYHDWQDDFCARANADTINHIDFYSMDWNLSSRPAALGDRAHILAAKGINVVREQTDYGKHQLVPAKFLFDAQDQEELLPKQTTACVQ